jgi:hypothetical protein
LYLQGKGKFLVSLNLISLELLYTTLCEGSQSFVGLQEGLWCDMGPEVQGGPLPLHLHHLAIHHIFISSLVAQLLDG